ncbi:hypothetical protein ACFO9Q_11590 [Paenibacillus sp. GCM10023252]|uniref:hypothetical protein n=1 Tax=Paenibacillus sp. GCM10023252 TaxID=3252649 RepID=UPI00361E699B
MKLMWFVANLFFVVSVITLLFNIRSVTEARQTDAAPDQVRRLVRRRNVLIAVTILLFFVMSASFVADMAMNG